MKKIIGLAMLALLSAVMVSGLGTSVQAEAAAKKTLNKTKATMYTGNTITLKVKKAKSVKWKSSNKKVAEVKKGKVTALAKGKATITAKVGKTKLKCRITVKSNYLNRKTVTLYKSGTFQIQAVKFKGTLKGWRSENQSVVSVSDTGLLKGLAIGTATVTVKLKRETYQCKVQVVDALTREDFNVEVIDEQGYPYTNFIDYTKYRDLDTDYLSADVGDKTNRGIGIGSSRNQVAAIYGETKRHDITMSDILIAMLDGLDISGTVYYYDYFYYESGVKYQLRLYFAKDKVKILLVGKGLT